MVKKNPLRARQSFGGRFFFLLRTNPKLAKLWIVWYIRYRKDNRPQRWVADRVKKNPLRYSGKSGGGFSMSVTFLLFVLKNERK